MKKRLTLLLIVFTTVFSLGVNAQGNSWDTGLDIYNTYIWRGTKFGAGPAFQPWVEFSNGGFAIGAWGSYSGAVLSGDSDSFMEADLYASYGFDLGENSAFSLIVTDYYFPESPWLEGTSHFIEPAVSVELGSFSFMGGYMLSDGVSDIYLEAGLSAGPVNFILAAGDGAYTIDGDFGICNIGISTSKEVAISESFSLPVSGAVILNPSSEAFHIVVGISL
ncbi:MAG: hypothetical protein HQ541_20095 [Mariniphaga sp.]|nr:hypothetical protein [Mariniphaga sp.]